MPSSRRSSPRRSLLLGAGIILGSGCSKSDPCGGAELDLPPVPDPSPSAPPSIVAGEWIGAGVLELEFTGALSSAGDLDPTLFSVMGWSVQAYDYSAYGGGGSSCRISTTYRPLDGSYYGGAPTVAQVWIGPEDDTRLRLRLASTAAQCPNLNGSLGTGVLLAYTDGGGAGAQLLDEGGTPLPAFGPDWAVSRLENCTSSGYAYGCYLSGYYSGQFPSLDSLVEIPCPS